ncbi:LysR substrate-binding domain-containing protein [Gordonia humi]|uniref:DNA-binding transcriptional LysR family regulator n=1 Tax=Gordonia humi TaxID=686429 RepID=A0A840F2K6_9ACTN|nr:LysR substrate-binding domain-containing protein [Gordonia humi]MBB4138142.1 DNA-binding transcriptional LysR family regulator [Gordonia humi]
MREFELFRDGMGGTVRIAAIPSAAAVLLPLLVREANERYPGIRIEIMDSLAQVALAGLLNGDVDIAITTSSNLPDSVLYTELLEDRFAVIHCSDHPFTTQKQVTWAELARESLVMFDGNSSIRTLTDAALTEIGASADITAEASSIPVIAGFVSAGIGVAAVPGLVTPLMMAPGIHSTPLGTPAVVRHVGIAQILGRSESPACTQIVALLREITTTNTAHPIQD